MTSYEDAVAAILDHIVSLPAEERRLADCLGQVAAEDIRSGISLPQAATSGPDGYALRAADIAEASREMPVTLRIGETVRAGALPKKKIEPGTAARVMTGSVVPKGADCVVRFEDTDEPAEKCGPNSACPSQVKIYVAPSVGTNIFGAGCLVRRGDLVVPKCTVIGPAQISALTSIGKTKIKVHRRPVIAILSTGDELAPSGKPLPAGKSYNSNTPALAALVRHHGGVAKIIGVARDNQASVEKKFAQGLEADAILSSGGVSKGDFDLIRLMLSKLGKVVFNRIQMGPGAAFTFGLLQRANGRRKTMVPVFALSGPPAGCLINFETLVRPAMRKMLGYTELRHPVVQAEAMDAVANRAPFNFVRWTQLGCTDEGLQASFTPANGAGMLTQMARSNALTILPKGAEIKAGDKVTVLPLDWVQ